MRVPTWPAGLFVFVALGLAACSDPAPAQVATTRELLAAMHDRHAERWYPAFTFEIDAEQYNADGTTDSAQWAGAQALPARLRIDTDRAERSGMLYVADTQYVYTHDTLAARQARIHPLMLAGYDVYAQAPDTTLARLQRLGFDTDALMDTSWNGAPAWVVGASAEAPRAAQLWIDKDQLLLRRMLLPVAPTGARLQEIQFNDYERLEGGWYPAEVRFLLDTTLIARHRYENVRALDAADDALFDPERFTVDEPYWQPAGDAR